MPNLVEITIKANDDTADGFASVLARYFALKNAMRGGIVIGVDDPGAITSTLVGIKQKVQSIGLADIADVNVSPGILYNRLFYIKRVMQQIGLGDVFGIGASSLLKTMGELRAFSFGQGPIAPIGGGGNQGGGGGTVVAAAGGGRGGGGGGGGGLAAIGGFLGSAIGLKSIQSGIRMIGQFITQWHSLGTAIGEVVATLLPATVAFIAFGAAAVPTVQNIQKQMQNANTVTEAFGKNVYPISGAFQRIADSVKPNVYVLFGEALQVINSKAGLFAQIAKGAGKVMDDLGARFVYAVTNGNALSTFFKNSTRDLSGWGTLIGNIGGIVGNFIKVLPGFAGVVLGLADGFTHLVEMITAGIEPVIKFGLALHGLLFYAGVVTAVLLALQSPIMTVGRLFATGYVAIERYFLSIKNAAGAAATFNAVVAPLKAVNPYAWVAIAAGAIIGLVIAFGRGSNAAADFNKSVQAAISNSSLDTLANTLRAGLTSSMTKLSAATVQLQKDLDGGARSSQVFAGRAGGFNQVILNDTAAVNTYAKGVAQVNQQQDTLNTHISGLTAQFGSTTAAWAMLNGAGITSAQLLDQNSAHWAQAQIEVNAFANAMKAMGLGAGQQAAAMNAMGNDFMTNVLPAIQKVTNAEDTLLNTLLGGEGSFTTFSQNLNQIANDAQVSGASITGLNSQSLTLANDYYNTLIPSAQTMIDKLRQQGASQGQLTTIVASAAAQLVPYAGNNQAAEQAIVNLINNALGPGTVNLQTFNTWIKNNSTDLPGLQSLVGGLETSAAGLSGTLNGLNGKTFRFNVDTYYASYYATYGLPPGSSAGTGGTGHAYGGITGAASGGLRSGLTVVGEQGTELIQLPSGSHVMPHSNQSAQFQAAMGGGGGTTQLVVVGGDSDFEKFMAKFIREFVRVKGGGNVQQAFGKQ